MSNKTMRNVAVIIIIVFVATIIAFPLIYGTDPEPANEPPVQLELNQ
ncbi:MAG: hypothetical protein KF799_07355 [Bdellovibrionales bacterium]|nr:hypothetical protein [Bdellovibrionales bacterium]